MIIVPFFKQRSILDPKLQALYSKSRSDVNSATWSERRCINRTASPFRISPLAQRLLRWKTIPRALVHWKGSRQWTSCCRMAAQQRP